MQTASPEGSSVLTIRNIVQEMREPGVLSREYCSQLSWGYQV